MAIFETFAKRKRSAQKGETPDVYRYDVLPSFLRKQLAMIFRETIGPYRTDGYPRSGNEIWTAAQNIMRREHESFHDLSGSNAGDRCLTYLLGHPDVDEVLSLVELLCRCLHHLSRRHDNPYDRGATRDASDALVKINGRFREHAVGYEATNGSLIRIDAQYTHNEIVKPALALLTMKGFEQANEEFVAAHKSYREGKHKDAIVAANRAFESTLKAICSLKGWAFQPGDTAKQLVTAIYSHGLLPSYLDNGLDTFIAMMKTGLPNVRNNAGGHGSSPDSPPVPEYIARYAIDLAAANIVLLATAYEMTVRA